MKQFKQTILFLMTFSLASTMQSAHCCHSYDSQSTYTIAAVGILGCGIGYGAYKLYENYSLSNALSRLMLNENISQRISDSVDYKFIFDEEQLVNTYRNRLQEYVYLCERVKNDLRALTAIEKATQDDIHAWSSTEKANSYLERARQFCKHNSQRLHLVKQYKSFYDKHIELIHLAQLLDEEINSDCYPLVYAARQGTLNEATVRMYNQESLWPFRTAWNMLERRKHLYQACINALTHDNQRYESQRIIEFGRDTIAAYQQAQAAIASFEAYVADLRAEKEFELKKEQIRQARIQAEAAQAAAQAQAHQAAILSEKARIQKYQLRQQKESELTQLRHDLSGLKQKIKNGDNGYYIQQQKQQLQSRIYSLKSELFGAPSLVQSIFEMFLDQD